MSNDKTEIETKYDPRSEYEWVPAVLAIVMTLVKCAVLTMPYIAAYNGKPEMKLIADETFNMVWVMTVSFWAGKKVSEKK